MEQIPAFNARGKAFWSWPLYRIYVGHDELYLIRIRWIFGLTRGRVQQGESGPDGCLALVVVIPVIAVLAGVGLVDEVRRGATSRRARARVGAR
jgi:hypothetical protein